MIFPERKSALVRLSDTLKAGLDSCAALTNAFLDLIAPHEATYQAIQRIAKRALGGALPHDQADQQIQEVLSRIPQDVSLRLPLLALDLDAQARTTALMACFCLESYVNSLAYFLLQEADFLGLIRDGHRISAEVLIDAIEQMSTRKKWETVGRLGGSGGFDRSRAPFQDFKCLFNFRDDHVHDKVVPIGEDRSKTRYNGKLPDPVFGTLDLRHAVYAVSTYWLMILEVHRLLGVDASSFHTHYNLAPWRDEHHRKRLEDLANRYAAIVPG